MILMPEQFVTRQRPGCTNAQSGLSLCCLHATKYGFLASRLKFLCSYTQSSLWVVYNILTSDIQSIRTCKFIINMNINHGYMPV